MNPRIESTGSHAGFDYCVMVMPMGHRCGYVLIPEGHPWHGKGYDDIDVEVHGGLTFCSNVDDTERWPKTGFWIGFDCAHYLDAPDFDEMSREYLKSYPAIMKAAEKMAEPLLEALGLGIEDWQKLPGPEKKLRQRVYVEGQCKQLAAQAAEAAKMRSEDSSR